MFDFSFAILRKIHVNPSSESFVVIQCCLTMPHKNKSPWLGIIQGVHLAQKFEERAAFVNRVSIILNLGILTRHGYRYGTRTVVWFTSGGCTSTAIIRTDHETVMSLDANNNEEGGKQSEHGKVHSDTLQWDNPTLTENGGFFRWISFRPLEDPDEPRLRNEPRHALIPDIFRQRL